MWAESIQVDAAAHMEPFSLSKRYSTDGDLKSVSYLLIHHSPSIINHSFWTGLHLCRLFESETGAVCRESNLLDELFTGCQDSACPPEGWAHCSHAHRQDLSFCFICNTNLTWKSTLLLALGQKDMLHSEPHAATELYSSKQKCVSNVLHFPSFCRTEKCLEVRRSNQNKPEKLDFL